MKPAETAEPAGTAGSLPGREPLPESGSMPISKSVLEAGPSPGQEAAAYSSGTAEKGDCIVTVSTTGSPGSLVISIESPVTALFGRHQHAAAAAELKLLGFTSGTCRIIDRQAVDPVIRARICAAVGRMRAAGATS